jgi:hypothetical protein
MTSKAKIEQAIRLLMEVMNGVPETPMETRPSAPRPSAVPAGWQKARVKAVSDKEVDTKRGPSRKVSLRLAWIDAGEAHEIWAGTFSGPVLDDIDRLGIAKGVDILVKVEQRGDFWNLMGVALPGGIREDEVPF